ncbi:MAG: hypothetical protein ACE5GM_04775 [bacterium]
MKSEEKNTGNKELRAVVTGILLLLSACSGTVSGFHYSVPSRPDYHHGEGKPWTIGEIRVVDKRPNDWIGYTRNARGEIIPLFIKQNLADKVRKALEEDLTENHYIISYQESDPLIEVEILQLDTQPISGDYGLSLGRASLLLKRFIKGRPSPLHDEKSRLSPKMGETPLRYSHGKNQRVTLEVKREFSASATEEIAVKFNAAQAVSTLHSALQKAIGKILQSHILHSHLQFDTIPTRTPIKRFRLKRHY